MLIPWRLLIYAWKSSNIRFVGNDSWSIWSKTSYDHRHCNSVSNWVFLNYVNILGPFYIRTSVLSTFFWVYFDPCLVLGSFSTRYLVLVWTFGWLSLQDFFLEVWMVYLGQWRYPLSSLFDCSLIQLKVSWNITGFQTMKHTGHGHGYNTTRTDIILSKMEDTNTLGYINQYIYI